MGPCSRTSLRSWCVVLSAALLAGCMAGTLKRKQLPLLHKGLTPAQARQLIGQPPRCSIDFQGGDLAMLQVYRVVPASRSHSYLLLYEYGRLTFWGYPSEFLAAEHPAYADLLSRARPLLAAGECDDGRQLVGR